MVSQCRRGVNYINFRGVGGYAAVQQRDMLLCKVCGKVRSNAREGMQQFSVWESKIERMHRSTR